MTLAAAGCGGHEVDPDEVPAALEKLPYEYSYRHVGRPPQIRRVVAGRARDASGVTLDFAVIVHGRGDGGPAQMPVVPHGLSGASCANYTFVSNDGDRSGLDRAGEERRLNMAIEIEHAVRDLAPDAHCEG